MLYEEDKGCLHWQRTCGKAYNLAGKVWGRESGIRHSISRFPYHQTDEPHKSGCLWWELCTQWCWGLTKTRWRCGLRTTLGYSRSSLSGQAVSSLKSLQVPPHPPTTTTTTTTTNATRLLVHSASNLRCLNCWWGMSRAGKITALGFF